MHTPFKAMLFATHPFSSCIIHVLIDWGVRCKLAVHLHIPKSVVSCVLHDTWLRCQWCTFTWCNQILHYDQFSVHKWPTSFCCCFWINYSSGWRPFWLSMCLFYLFFIFCFWYTSFSEYSRVKSVYANIILSLEKKKKKRKKSMYCACVSPDFLFLLLSCHDQCMHFSAISKCRF